MAHLLCSLQLEKAVSLLPPVPLSPSVSAKTFSALESRGSLLHLQVPKLLTANGFTKQGEPQTGASFQRSKGKDKKGLYILKNFANCQWPRGRGEGKRRKAGDS